MSQKKVKRIYAKPDEYVKVIRKYPRQSPEPIHPFYPTPSTTYPASYDRIPRWLYGIFGVIGFVLIICFWQIILACVLIAAALFVIWLCRAAIWKAICRSAQKLWAFTVWNAGNIAKLAKGIWNLWAKRKNKTVDTFTETDNFPELYN